MELLYRKSPSSTQRFITRYPTMRFSTRCRINSIAVIASAGMVFMGLRIATLLTGYRKLKGIAREATNIITLHLGNGCSIAAIKGGNSIDTSMCCTPLEGLVMGKRSGDLDASIVDLITAKEGLSGLAHVRLWLVLDLNLPLPPVEKIEVNYRFNRERSLG